MIIKVNQAGYTPVPYTAPVGILETEVIDFDGIDDLVVLSSDLGVDIEENKTITFDCFLETNASSSFYNLFSFKSTNEDDFLVVSFSPGQNLIVIRKDVTFGQGHNYDISSYKDINISCEIIKTSSGITSFKIDSATITPIGNFAVTEPTSSNIGNFPGQSQIANYLSVWNIVISGLHSWGGYGNLNTNWVDSIGSIDGSVCGNPSLRNI